MNTSAQTLGLLLLLSGFFRLQAEADPRAEYNWDHPNEVIVLPREMAFTSGNIGATKNESIYLWVYSPGGVVFLFSFFHVDTLLFDRWGMYALVADPEGNVYWITDTPQPRSIWYADDYLSITDGEMFFSGRGGRYRLTGGFEGLSCDISLESRLPAWKPGTGRLDYTQDGSSFQFRVLVVPWARASGTIEVDGKRFSINGHGYVSKTRFSNPLTRFAPYIHSLKLYDDDTFLYMLDVTLNEAYDNRVVPMLVLAHKNRWLFTTRNYAYTVESYAEDDELPYPYPKTIRVVAEDKGYRLEGVYRESRRLNVTDVFAELPQLVRNMLDMILSRPVFFRAIGAFSGTLTYPDGTIRRLELDGPYEYTVVR